MKRFGGLIVGIVLFFGVRFYSIHETKTEVRTQLDNLCEKEAACLSAVATHFEVCFDESSSFGGRRSGAKLDGSKLVSCVNEKAGEEWFSYDEEKE